MYPCQAADEVGIRRGITPPTPCQIGCRSPDGRGQEVPPAILWAPNQALGEAAAAGRGTLPDDACQGAFLFPLQVGQGQQGHGGTQAASEQEDPAAWEARRFKAVDHAHHLLRLHGSKGDRWSGATPPQGVVSPPVGKDGGVELGEPLQGGAGPPAIISEPVKKEHRPRRGGRTGEPPELQPFRFLRGPGTAGVPVLALRQFPVGGLHPGERLRPIERRVHKFPGHRPGLPPEESAETQQGRQAHGDPEGSPHQ